VRVVKLPITEEEARQVADEIERRIALMVAVDNKRLAEMDIAAMIDEYPESIF
jgi:hypothetical protein